MKAMAPLLLALLVLTATYASGGHEDCNLLDMACMSPGGLICASECTRLQEDVCTNMYKIRSSEACSCTTIRACVCHQHKPASQQSAAAGG